MGLAGLRSGTILRPQHQHSSPMRYEHLVQINDPLMPLLDTLTRNQLWQGLEKATIHTHEVRDGIHELTRTLDFGSFQVEDRVRLVRDWRSEIHTKAGPTWPASRLTITIEEPEPELLFLRFLYESEESASEAQLDPVIAALREQAYESADLDTVVRIRALAEQGVLG
jgi:hypothetical protein